MRQSLTRAFTGAALVSGLVAAPLAWTQANIVDETGFATMVQPLATDPAFQDGLGSALGQDLADQLPIPGKGLVGGFIGPVVQEATKGITEDPRFEQAWGSVARLSHEEFFGQRDPGQGRFLSLDIGPVVDVATSKVADTVGFEIPSADSFPVKLSDVDQRQLSQWLSRAGSAAPWFLGAAALFALLALVSSSRRAATLRNLGLSALAVAAVVKVAGWMVLPAVMAGDNPSPVGAHFLEGIERMMEGSLDGWVAWIAAGGAAALVAGLAGQVASRSKPQLGR